MRPVALGWLLFPLGLGLACGGKFSQTGEGDEGSGGTSSGAPASGGKSQGQGSSSRAGASSKGGGVSQGGQPSSGGTCSCAGVDCKPGYEPVPTPGGCCYTCEAVTCTALPCQVPPSCPPGYYLALPPGACCPSCQVDTCASARDDYLQYSRRVIEKYSTLGCMSDQDCGLYYEKNSCNVSCGAPMPWNAFQSLEQDLQAYAKVCDYCPFPDAPPCVPAPQPRCLNGRCQQSF